MNKSINASFIYIPKKNNILYEMLNTNFVR